MSKQYISTVSTGAAHESDILDLAVTNRYTVTVSSDGYANFWDNKQDETHDPRKFVTRKLVNRAGLHHVAAYESVLPGSQVKVVVLAVVAFDGSLTFLCFVQDDIKTLVEVSAGGVDGFKELNSWCPGFYIDPESKSDYLVVTQASGETAVYRMEIAVDGKKENAVSIALEKFGTIKPTHSSTPNSLAISATVEKKIAIGYTSGEVVLYDLESLKPIYTFKSTDVGGSGSSSVPRAIRFSPGGSILAVARDNQSVGSITLYDAKYGENVGSLTTPSHSSKTKNVGGFAHDGWIMGLSFDEEGKLLASCGFDKCIRVWNMETRERVATITVSVSDLDGDAASGAGAPELDHSVVSGVQFIKKGIRGGLGGDTNEGLCAISFDRGIRWYREAGGI
ncbi:antiviral protein Ski8p [[Candida] anglica]